MKKLLALILCMMLCLPAAAWAEGVIEAPELAPVDFGTFTMNLSPNDHYEMADEMVNGTIYALIYPNLDPLAVIADNINVVWAQEDASAEISLFGAESYAQLILDMAKPQFEALNIKMNDGKVLSAIMEDNVFATVSYSELDYTGAGVDLVTPQYQMQVYFCLGEAGTYIFTITATTMEQLEALSAYVDSVVFK